MVDYGKLKAIVIFLVLMFFGSCFYPVTLSENINYNIKPDERFAEGQILFSPYYGTTTYLIDGTGAVNHTWPSAYRPFTEAYWLGDGSIMRPIISGSGGVQRINWDGSIDWDYRYTAAKCTCHHDIKVLPNGNVLMIVWVEKTGAEAIAAGRNPSTIQGNSFKPDKIIEVKPTGLTSGEIVWEWHVWDHLIQDFDPSKDNYGDVGDHPELIDINYGDAFVGDWLHTNSVDYNPQFDQILIDVHNFNEVWVIDHSTTIEEAAGHSGGNSGMGGDLLYRWGNPEAYDAGTNSDQKLFFQHDATWIKPGLPGEGNILVFNNGNNRPSGQYSTVDEFTPPVDSNGEYYLEEGEAYGPEDYTWSYTASPPNSFYSMVFGGVHRLKDGNTLICDGVPGRFFEVTPDGTTVWEYLNPYPNLANNDVFKIDYIAPPQPPEPEIPDLDCKGKISWVDVKPGKMVYGSFEVSNIGNDNSLLNWEVKNWPNWGEWSFNPSNGINLSKDIPVTVTVTCVSPDVSDQQFTGTIEVSNIDNETDFCTISVDLTTPRIKVQDMFFIKFLQDHSKILQILIKVVNRLSH